MSALISIIIPCYNQGQFLADAIQSALIQSYPHKEIIVVNDGSTDNTADVARSFAHAVHYIEQPNQGISGARNAGIRYCKGEYVSFLDSDDVYLEDTLATTVSYLENHPHIFLVCGDALLLRNGTVLGLKSSISGRPRNHRNFRWETAEYYATPSTVTVRRLCFERTGLFAESLTRGAEDWHMWVRMSRHFDMSYIDKPLIYYRLHEKNITGDKERIDRANRDALKLILDSPYFQDYPAHFRAKLFIFRFASGWKVEPKRVALGYLLKGLKTDPTQLPYCLKVIRRGISNLFTDRSSPFFSKP